MNILAEVIDEDIAIQFGPGSADAISPSETEVPYKTILVLVELNDEIPISCEIEVIETLIREGKLYLEVNVFYPEN